MIDLKTLRLGDVVYSIHFPNNDGYYYISVYEVQGLSYKKVEARYIRGFNSHGKELGSPDGDGIFDLYSDSGTVCQSAKELEKIVIQTSDEEVLASERKRDLVLDFIRGQNGDRT